MFTFREIMLTAIVLGLLALSVIGLHVYRLRQEDKLITVEYDDDDIEDDDELDDDDDYDDDDDEDDEADEDDDYDDDEEYPEYVEEISSVNLESAEPAVDTPDYIAIRDFARMQYRAENPHLFADDWFDICRREYSLHAIRHAQERAAFRKKMGLAA